MDERTLWAYKYDQLFLKSTIKPNFEICQQLQLTTDKISPWPISEALPELAKLYQILEHYIFEDRNWMSSSMTEQDIQEIQEDLNNLLINFQCQKQYGTDWNSNPRRIQASVIHFFLFFKRFIYILVPKSYKTLMQANSDDNLITDIFKLQQLVNEIIQLLGPIHQFMYNSIFQEELQLTKSFFKEFSYFLKHIPKIKIGQMTKIPSIMNYIVVCSSIDFTKMQIKKEQNSSGSYFRKQKLKTNHLRYFKFEERVRKNTFQKSRNKPTITSIDSRSFSFDKERSSTMDNSATFLELKKLKRGTIFEPTSRDQSNSKGRSRVLTAKTSLSKSSISKSQSKIKSIDLDQIEQEREDKKKGTKKKSNYAFPKLNKQENKININVGKAKGWGIIRQYVKSRIAQRKLNKLISL